VEQFVATTLRVASPIVFVALGGLFAYRAGIFHLGLEGQMLIGAFASVAGTVWTGNVWLGIGLGVLVNLVVSALFWVLIVPLRANAIICGLGLSVLGAGATTFALSALFDTRGQIRAPEGLPRPVTGVNAGPLAALSELSILVWLMPVFAAVVWIVLRRTRFGLRLTAVGEYPFAARSAGVDVARMRLVALLVSGTLCTLGGADLALGALRSFQENMTNGRGFLGFSSILFGAGDPIGTSAAAVFFGLAQALGIQAQLLNLEFPPVEFVLMLPFVVTIAAVWLSGMRRRGGLDTSAAFGELRE
jgi:simple sugar transport system permease protein